MSLIYFDSFLKILARQRVSTEFARRVRVQEDKFSTV
jgi:hypothetical protein